MKPGILIITIISAFLVTGFQQGAVAQCCAAGNPANTDLLQQNAQKNSLLLLATYKYSYSDTYYHLDHKLNEPQVQYSRYNFMSTQFVYGLTKKINIFGELGYFFDKTQVLTIMEGQVLQGKGLGDLLLGARYVIISKPVKGHLLNFSAGIKLPVGVFDQTENGVVLPLSLQPSTGTTKYNGSACYSYYKTGNKFGGYVLASLEISSTISSPNFYYKYGNFLSTIISGTYKIKKYCSLSLQGRLESRAKDERAADYKVQSTGSEAVFLAPSVQFFIPGNWILTVQADFPVYKYVNGYQMTNKYGSTINLSKRIIFKTKEKELK